MPPFRKKKKTYKLIKIFHWGEKNPIEDCFFFLPNFIFGLVIHGLKSFCPICIILASKHDLQLHDFFTKKSHW